MSKKRWQTGSKVQTLIFDKSRFTRGEAKQWAKDNGFKMKKVDEKENTYRVRQLPPSKFADMRTITLTKGVKAIVGPLKNPAVGSRPDLFESDETPIVVEDWRELSPETVIEAYVKGQLDDDVLGEIYEENEELHDAMVEANEEAQEERVEPIVEALKREAEFIAEYETEGDGVEAYQDLFQDWLAHTADTYDLFGAARQALSELGVDYEFSDERLAADALEEWLKDPAAFEVRAVDGYASDAVYDIYLDDHEWDIDPSFWDYTMEEVEANAPRVGWPRPSDAKEIERQVDNASIDTDGLKDVLKDMAEGDGDVDSRMYIHAYIGQTIAWYYEPEYIKDAFDEVYAEMEEGAEPLGELIEESGPDVDDVVYDDLPDGFYVADLEPEALPWEGRKLGICVGREDMGYIGRVQRGEIKIFSLRTASGKPKFTIEAELEEDGEIGTIEQIKGKANRLPGFAAGAYGELTKPQEVEMLTKFVEHLGIDPESIDDLRPGYRALYKDGKRKNPMPKKASIPVSKKVQKLAKKAYNEPWGGVWGCPI